MHAVLVACVSCYIVMCDSVIVHLFVCYIVCCIPCSSGDQKRRVSFALALLHEPPLFILDEPTVGIDPLLRVRYYPAANNQVVLVLGCAII